MSKKALKNYYTDSIYKMINGVIKKEQNINGYLYFDSKITNIKESDLSKSYIKVSDHKKTSYINAQNIKHVVYMPNYTFNHLYKDDFIYISFNKRIIEDDTLFRVKNFDYLLFGPSIVDFTRKLKEFKLLDLENIEQELINKKRWYEEKKEPFYKKVMVESNYIGVENKINLSDVLDVLEMSDVDNISFYNKETNEILWIMSNNMEYSTYKEEDEFNDNIIYMFGFESKNDYQIMQEFIETIKDAKMQNKLFSLTRGSGAFNRFRNFIDNNYLTDNWYKFKDSKYKEIAIYWCEENDIAYIDDL